MRKCAMRRCARVANAGSHSVGRGPRPYAPIHLQAASQAANTLTAAKSRHSTASKSGPRTGTGLPKRAGAKELARHPVLLYEPGGQTQRLADAWFARAGKSLQPAMSLGSVEAIKELVTAGLGCAVLPGMAVQTTQHGSALEVRPLSPPQRRALAIVLRKDKRLHRGLRETVAALQALRR